MAGGVITLTFDAKLKGAVENFIKVAEKVKDVDGGMKRLTASVNSAGKEMHKTGQQGTQSFLNLTASVFGGVSAANLMAKAVGLVTQAFHEMTRQQEEALSLTDKLYASVANLMQISQSPDIFRRRMELAKQISGYGLKPDEALSVVFAAESRGMSEKQTQLLASLKPMVPDIPNIVNSVAQLQKAMPERDLKAEQIVGMIVKAAEPSRLDIPQLAHYLGGPLSVAKSIKASPEEIMASLALSADVLTAERVSAGMVSFMTDLQAAASNPKKRKLMKKAGLDPDALLAGGLNAAVEATGRLTERQRFEIFGEGDVRARMFTGQAQKQAAEIERLTEQVAVTGIAPEEYVSGRIKTYRESTDPAAMAQRAHLANVAAQSAKELATYEVESRGAAERSATKATEQERAVKRKDPYLLQAARSIGLGLGGWIAPKVTRDVETQKRVVEASGEATSAEAQRTALNALSPGLGNVVGYIRDFIAIGNLIEDTGEARRRQDPNYVPNSQYDPNRRRATREEREILGAFESAAGLLSESAKDLKNSRDPAKRSTGGVE